MKYIDFINQTVEFPTTEFEVKNDELYFHGVRLLDVVEKYGTPVKLCYRPKISENVNLARSLFHKAMKSHSYQGDYHYAYCTKSSHFRFVLEEALKNGCHIETSSSFDIPIIRRVYEAGQFPKDGFILCNGFKKDMYTTYISDLINDGFTNTIPILDNREELNDYKSKCKDKLQVGIRVATDELPSFEFYTSRLGFRYSDVIPFFEEKIKNDIQVELKLLHFFVHNGINDTPYFWGELNRFIEKYCELKKICPSLNYIDLGGGLPIKTGLLFEFDYEYIIDQIIATIKQRCRVNNVPTPDIFTEFGSFTVGESGATIYKVLNQKKQNDKELWYMIDGSFITHLPDSWGLNQKFTLLPLNQWTKDYQKVNLGGLTCDSMDYYNSESNAEEVYMPTIDNGSPLYIGFFGTGAYQESLGGFGGIQHCLIPSPKIVLIDKDEQGIVSSELFKPEEPYETMLNILGY